MSGEMPELYDADLKDPRAGVEEMLGLTGAKTVPGKVNLGQVDMTMDVGQGGFGKVTRDGATIGATAINGVSVAEMFLLAPTGFSAGSFVGTTGKSLSNEVARVQAAEITLTFDAAGAAAFAGKIVANQWNLRDAPNTVRAAVFQQEKTIAATGGLIWRFPLLMWNGLVFQDQAFTVSLIALDGTNFPANTTMLLRGFHFFKRKKGGQVPI